MVSLIMPCYNSENYIERSIKSVLNQTYHNIQLILVNDGSVDNTDLIVNSMKEEIEERITAFIYIKQENKGLGAACNRGFKEATGKYLMLLDSDDYLCQNSIKKCVEFLDFNPSYYLVRTNGCYVKEGEYDKDLWLFEYDAEKKSKTKLFADLLYGDAYMWAGTYLVRMDILNKLYPSHEIYPARDGQNLQFTLMPAYYGKAGYIDEILMKYTIRKESLSKSSSGNMMMKEIKNMEAYKEIRFHLIDEFLDNNEGRIWHDRLEVLYLKKYLSIACKYNSKKLVQKYYHQLVRKRQADLDTKITYYKVMNPVIYMILRIIRKMKSIRKNYET